MIDCTSVGGGGQLSVIDCTSVGGGWATVCD